MGKFRGLVDSPEVMVLFLRDYGIPNDVNLMLAKVDAKRMGTRSISAFPLAAIVQGVVTFSLDPLVRRFLHQVQLMPIQVFINLFRVICGVSTLNRRLGLNPNIWDILVYYILSHNKDHITYYLRVWSVDSHLVTNLPDCDKYNDDFLQVGGNWEFPFGIEIQTKRMPQKDRYPEPFITRGGRIERILKRLGPP